MEKESKDLIRIIPDKINTANDNIFLGLALIRNDLGDLIYLQSLHTKGKKQYEIEEVSAERGQEGGRNIYILRLALSSFYNFLEFLYMRKNDIQTNNEFLLHLKKLSRDDQKLWLSFTKMAEYYKQPEQANKLNRVQKNILLLASAARNKITYHYHGILRHIKSGFKIAFNDRSKPNSKYAYTTELDNINKDRSYYIDLSLQCFLEDILTSQKISIAVIEKDTINIIAGMYRIISKLLKSYHIAIKE